MSVKTQTLMVWFWDYWFTTPGESTVKMAAADAIRTYGQPIAQCAVNATHRTLQNTM
jgi:hypothetical protein